MKKQFAVLFFSLLCVNAFAEDRALLIGLGKYQLKSANLPGIELDLAMMQNTAQALGFQTIKTLQNEDATLKNVESALSTWLTDGIGKDDRILIYYSGHGTFIPDKNSDEIDRHDEALTMYDMKLARGTLQNVLVDDRFHELLEKIPSDHILVLLDACHSGTATRASRGEFVPKTFHWEGMGNINKTRSIVVSDTANTQSARIITLSAARDNEQSLASHEGSLFTVGLKQTIEQAIANNSSLSPASLQQNISTFLSNRIRDKSSLFHPQLSGNADVLQRPLATTTLATPTVTPTDTKVGIMAQRLNEYFGKFQPLNVRLNQNHYKKGDKLSIHVDVNQSGYLNIIEINANDQATVLFPNQYHQDNQVQAGAFTLPTEQMNFDLTADEPFGQSIVWAFLTSQNINLYKDGKVDQIFATMSANDLPKLSRAIGVSLKKQSVTAGKAEASVCPNESIC